MNKIVSTLWINSYLPPAQRGCLASFVRHGYAVHLYTYHDIQAPDGVEVCDANKIIPENEIFYYGKAAGPSEGSLGSFSNLFRYKLLHEGAECWVDADVCCLKPLPDTEYIIPQEFDGGNTKIASHIIHVPKSCPMIDECYSIALSLKHKDQIHTETGPMLFGKMVHKYGLFSKVAPVIEHCPIGWIRSEMHKFELPGQIPEQSYTIHLWNEIWRRRNMQIPWPGPAGSILHDLATR